MNLLIQNFYVKKIEGWYYLILDKKGKIQSSGYYRTKKRAEHSAKLALSTIKKESKID